MPDLTLETGVIQLWIVRLSPDLRFGTLQKTLSALELERANRYRFERDRTRFIVARGTLRDLLGRYLQLSPSAVQLEYAPKGKPFTSHLLAGHSLAFNLSHSGDIICFAFSLDCDLGVDVEEKRPLAELADVAQSHFSAPETEAILRVAGDARLDVFYQLWVSSQKSRVVKFVKIA